MQDYSLNNSSDLNSLMQTYPECFQNQIDGLQESNNNIILNPIINNNEEKTTGKTDTIKKDSKKRSGKKVGRKPKKESEKEESDEEVTHNKYSNDNMTRKTKSICINEVLKFINSEIYIRYNRKIGQGKNIKKLKLLNYEQIKNATIDYNKDFLNKKIGEIFSENISKRIKSYKSDHNQKLIENLKNEEDEEKKIYFNNLFNLTFLDCLKYFRGEDDDTKYVYIKGLRRFKDLENDDEFKKKYDKDYDKDYIDQLKNFMKDYENELREKKGRKSRKKINEENDASNQ